DHTPGFVTAGNAPNPLYERGGVVARLHDHHSGAERDAYLDAARRDQHPKRGGIVGRTDREAGTEAAIDAIVGAVDREALVNTHAEAVEHGGERVLVAVQLPLAVVND